MKTRISVEDSPDLAKKMMQHCTGMSLLNLETPASREQWIYKVDDRNQVPEEYHGLWQSNVVVRDRFQIPTVPLKELRRVKAVSKIIVTYEEVVDVEPAIREFEML